MKKHSESDKGEGASEVSFNSWENKKHETLIRDWPQTVTAKGSPVSRRACPTVGQARGHRHRGWRAPGENRTGAGAPPCRHHPHLRPPAVDVAAKCQPKCRARRSQEGTGPGARLTHISFPLDATLDLRDGHVDVDHHMGRQELADGHLLHLVVVVHTWSTRERPAHHLPAHTQVPTVCPSLFRTQGQGHTQLSEPGTCHSATRAWCRGRHRYTRALWWFGGCPGHTYHAQCLPPIPVATDQSARPGGITPLSLGRRKGSNGLSTCLSGP